MLRIAILSLADINNYGDAFFPLVAKSELSRRIPDAEIGLFTNIEYENGLYKTTAYSKELISQFDAVILAGGELISPMIILRFVKPMGTHTMGFRRILHMDGLIWKSPSKRGFP